MELNEYFSTQCRATGVLLKTQSPSLKNLFSDKNRKNKDGVVATYDFDNFKLNISYIERGNSAYAQQTVWLSFVLDCDPTIPFSVYDILAYTQPDNFTCYTYTYVDSKELMRNCFGEINELLTSLIPELTAMLEDGVQKNRLITSQRESVNRYFGDNVLESGEMLGGAADKIINLMLKNFFEAQIEAAVIGPQSHFYNGKPEKALKKLKKAKYRTLYHENLIKYIENGGKAQNVSETAKSASAENGIKRHGGGFKGGLKLLGLTFLFDIPVTAVLIGIFYLICSISFKESIYLIGIWENIILMPTIGVILSTAIALHYIKYRQTKKKDQGDKTIHTPKHNKTMEVFLKYFTIFAECIVILGCMTSVYSTTAFYDDSFKYSQEDFPLSQNEINYSAIDYFAVVEGYTFNGTFQKDPHIVAVTKSGEKIDLYNSTYLSSKTFEKETKSFFAQKGIEIKSFKTNEEIK